MKGKIPIKIVKQALKKYHQGEISTEACIEVREILTNILDVIAQSGAIEFEEQNRIRQEQNLPKTKRMDSSVFIKFSEILFKPHPAFNSGSRRKINVYSDSTDAGEIA